MLTAAGFCAGLPAARRYGFNEDTAYRAPPSLGGFGPRFGGGGHGLVEHANWCPLRAREALHPVPRLPPMSKIQGPGFFKYPQDDDEGTLRYGRSQRDGSNLRHVSGSPIESLFQNGVDFR